MDGDPQNENPPVSQPRDSTVTSHVYSFFLFFTDTPQDLTNRVRAFLRKAEAIYQPSALFAGLGV